MKALLIILVAYLIGSIPNGVIIAKIFCKIDPTKSGSGNIGATNVYRTAGKIPGIITLILDILKGFLPVYFAKKWGLDFQIVLFTGLAAFLGHLFPVFLKFKGGKGVATAIGIFLVLTPLAVLIASIIFFIVAYIWRYVSLASMISSFLLPAIIKVLIIFKFYNYPDSMVYFAGTISILIIYKHKANIQRLIEKKEFKFGQKWIYFLK